MRVVQTHRYPLDPHSAQEWMLRDATVDGGDQVVVICWLLDVRQAYKFRLRPTRRQEAWQMRDGGPR